MNRIAAIFAAVLAAGAYALPPQSFYRPTNGAASLGTNCIMRSAMFDKVIPIDCETHELTVAYWAAAKDADGADSGISPNPRGGDFLPSLFYTPKHEPGGPDELNGAWGWGGASVSVNGTRSVNYAFTPFQDGRNGGETGLESFPRGVYCVRWKDATATFTCNFGAEEFTVTQGDGERNVDPKTGPNGVILTGNGSLKFGFSKIKIHEFFSTGFGDTGGSGDATMQQFNRELVSSNYVFAAHRIRLDQNVHTAAVDVLHVDGTARRRGQAFALPVDGTRTLSPETMMRLCYYCIGDRRISYLYEWDFRVFPKWLEDDEISGIFEDGQRVRQQFGYMPFVLTNAVQQVDP